MTLKTYSYVT